MEWDKDTLKFKNEERLKKKKPPSNLYKHFLLTNDVNIYRVLISKTLSPNTAILWATGEWGLIHQHMN